jgi:hypothetical protein
MSAPAVLGLYVVEWVDSQQPEHGWRFLDADDSYSPILVRSVGSVIRQSNPEVVVLCPSLSVLDEDGDIQAMGVLRIPARAIIRRWPLEYENEVPLAGPPVPGANALVVEIT